MKKITRKPYKKPKIIHEAKLEVKAGSVIPFGAPPDPLNPQPPRGGEDKP